jgi:hypothetical protein
VSCPTNIKWFGKLTTLSQPVESLKVERVEGQITMIKVSGLRRAVAATAAQAGVS